MTSSAANPHQNFSQALRDDIQANSRLFSMNKTNSFSFLLNSQNLLNLQSSKAVVCIERIQECKTFGKFLYERKQFEEAQK